MRVHLQYVLMSSIKVLRPKHTHDDGVCILIFVYEAYMYLKEVRRPKMSDICFVLEKGTATQDVGDYRAGSGVRRWACGGRVEGHGRAVQDLGSRAGLHFHHGGRKARQGAVC